MPRQQLHVLFAGHVQGVGFRATARHIASGFDVQGYVRNCDDGRVELVAEGEAAEVAAFVAAIREDLSDRIRDCTIDQRPPTNHYHDFRIRA